MVFFLRGIDPRDPLRVGTGGARTPGAAGFEGIQQFAALCRGVAESAVAAGADRGVG
jgi:hypothetical protein